jgi:glycosyltransferase involved in cell wall biosynthesis
VATLNPGKGYEDLLSALAAVPSGNWRLTCAGSLTRHPPTVVRVRALIRELGLTSRVMLVGEQDANALGDLYDRSDVFVLATLRETYGMAVAEALSRGIPVVSTMTGAIPDLVGSDAGLLVMPGDVQGLTAAIWQFLSDASLRTRLAAGARRVRPLLPGWDDMVAKMAETLESLDHD